MFLYRSSPYRSQPLLAINVLRLQRRCFDTKKFLTKVGARLTCIMASVATVMILSGTATAQLRVVNGDFSDLSGLESQGGGWYAGVPSGWTSDSADTKYAVNIDLGPTPPTCNVSQLKNLRQELGTLEKESDVTVTFDNHPAFFGTDKWATITATILDGALTPLVSSQFPVGEAHQLLAPKVAAGTTLSVEFKSASIWPGTSPPINNPGLDNVSVSPSAETDAAAAAITVLEGRFGRVEIDTQRPGLTALTLRKSDGQLDSQSILAKTSRKAKWALGAYTYVDVEDGRRMESRASRPESVTVEKERVEMKGIPLNVADGFAPLATEDWELSVEGDELVWKVTRTWLTSTRVGRSGMPALFLGFHAPFIPNSTVSTYWYQPEYISGKFDALYDLPDQNGGMFHPRTNKTFIRDEDPWAIFKLWTNWQSQVDLRLEAKNAYLYRAGGFCWLNEVGTVIGDANWQRRSAGQVETCELRIGAIDKTQTGYQLKVTLPDKEFQDTMTGFYSSLLNGGIVAEQETYAFGNESDGYITGAIFVPMTAAGVAAGVPAAGALSKRPFTVVDALRQELEAGYSTVSSEGLERYAYNATGRYKMLNLEAIGAAKDYLLHTGDLSFVRANVERMERQIAFFTANSNDDGLYVQASAEGQPAWYYDVIHHDGVSSFINSLFYRALESMVEIEHALGRETQAAEYRATAERLKTGFNKVLWREDLPGGPRYVDWITLEGREVTYFCDICQYPPVAFGIASLEEAKKVLGTADKRLAELADLGYQGFGSPSALWPIPDELCALDWQKNSSNPFGFYFNGGHLLHSTYFELMARAAAGDQEGLYRRFDKFAELIRKNGASGSNWFDWQGNPGFAGIYDKTEPYLADMIRLAGALTEGMLGIRPTWDKLEVQPCLPDGWKDASATVLYKGKPWQVTIKDGHATATEQ